jgi:TonB family protein
MAPTEDLGVGRILLASVLVVFGYVFGNETRAFAQEPVQDCPQSASSTGNVIAPHLTKRVNPQYPTTARMNFADGNATVEGDVVMDVVIAADGSVRNIKVTHGLPQLINLATHAVSQWQYEPERIDGVGIACKTTIKVSFKLNNDPAAAAAANAANNFAPPVPPSGVVGVKPALPPPPEGVMRISARTMENMLEKRIEPVYPADAVALDARGMVFLLVTVGKTGQVNDVQVLSGPDRFHDAAVNAVKQWHYHPYLMEGEAVDVQTTITLNFAPPH